MKLGSLKPEDDLVSFSLNKPTAPEPCVGCAGYYDNGTTCVYTTGLNEPHVVYVAEGPLGPTNPGYLSCMCLERNVC